ATSGSDEANRPAGVSPTAQASEPQERETAGGGKLGEVEMAGGYLVGQARPNDESDESKQRKEAVQKAHDASYESRSKCPFCHVPDGVREGMNHCDSCGASWEEGKAKAGAGKS